MGPLWTLVETHADGSHSTRIMGIQAALLGEPDMPFPLKNAVAFSSLGSGLGRIGTGQAGLCLHVKSFLRRRLPLFQG